MIKELIDNNYILIDNFITPKQAKTLYEWFKRDSQLFPDKFIRDVQCPSSLGLYNYKHFVDLLVQKIPNMKEYIGEQVLPTYSYARVYAHNETLEKHTDRPACEISVTVHLDSDETPWDIFFTKPNGEIVSCNLKPGQAVIYLGMESEHWREAFTGKHYGQVFLHYVRAAGEHWDCYFDRNIKPIYS